MQIIRVQTNIRSADIPEKFEVCHGILKNYNNFKTSSSHHSEI